MARIWSAMQTDLVDHVYSTNASEIVYLCHFYGFSIEGPKGTTTGYAYTSPLPSGDTVPVYRLYSIGLTDHFLTTSEEAKIDAMKRWGYHLEGVLGYVYETGGAGRVPLYQLHNKPIHDHYYTTSEREREDASKNGWTEEDIIGYLLQLEDDAPKLVVPSELPKP
ncbi:hypothetical protein C0989_010772 [Termitomyces sp. Mn162]|nr:hypothetical protein C0989_010772 [Termitomyces sp. Mn162]